MMGYQAEAEKPTITLTAAGEPTLLADTELPAADGVLLLAAPRSRLVNGRDDAVPVSHQHQVFDAITHGDKELTTLPEANHYFSGGDQRSPLRGAADLVHDWTHRHGFTKPNDV